MHSAGLNCEGRRLSLEDLLTPSSTAACLSIASSNSGSSQAVLLSKASASYYWICFSPTSSWKVFPFLANPWDRLLPRGPSLNSWIISLQSKPGLNVSLYKNHLHLLIIALSFSYCLKYLLLSCHPDTSEQKPHLIFSVLTCTYWNLQTCHQTSSQSHRKFFGYVLGFVYYQNTMSLAHWNLADSISEVTNPGI